MLKSYRVTIEGWGEMETAVAAATPGQAKAREWRQCNLEAGYDVAFTRFRAVRAPEFDDAIDPGATSPYSLGWKDHNERQGVYYRLSESNAVKELSDVRPIR